MKNIHILAALLLALPVAAVAQTTKPTTTTTTKPTTTTTTAPAGTQQQTEVTEDLDPATGKVIRRTTRTINVPVGTAPAPSSTSTTISDEDAPVAAASDAQVSTFLRKKTTVSTLTTSGLLSAYDAFMNRVRDDRSNWKPSDWTAAAGILSSLNGRYQQLRSSFSLDDKLTIRSQQAEFQALRTAKQISTQVSDKL
ncbi:hypothetical protein [Hymenobacter negativus]|uniref:Uncharacterized protein n=1 Tax=Hymenobacter negativus TaxID=2795026 RepID=A0ABS3QEH5_9BACT|nr:hypothetical protein [Hymenobacter negativus]MBO2009650.1 hypothetical protein [Hymenobacter negativus]